MWRKILPISRAKPASAADRPQVARVRVLEQGRTPSGDYLLRPWLAANALIGETLDTREPPRAGQIAAGDLVVIARYLPPAWFKVLEAQREQLAGIVYFMDDDLLDPAVLHDLPKAYSQKIQQLATAHRDWLKKSDAGLWVSTPALARKYAAWSPTVLPMSPPRSLMAPRPGVRIAYHGTGSHWQEIEWLHAVVSRVLDSRPETHVELFGDLAVHRAYRDLPRVSVLHPMSWENYLAYTGAHRCDIGLAPLRPGRFNAARGPTKFWDYARMGAVGVYTDVEPFAGFIRNGIDGVLVPDEPAAWIDAILQLIDNPERRADLSRAAGERAGC